MPVRRQFYEKDWDLYFRCKDCWEFKKAECYSKHVRCFMWITNVCKECEKIRHSNYYKNNKEELNTKNRKRYEERKDIYNYNNRKRYAEDIEYRDKILRQNKKRRNNNPEKQVEISKNYYLKNKSEILRKQKDYYNNNKEYILERSRKYWEENKEKFIKASMERKKNNRDLVNKYQKKYREKRWKEQYDAHKKVEKFIKDNWIKISKCPICWEEKRIIAHHPTSPDYSKRNIVVFCCDSCHSSIHRWKIVCPKPIDLLTYKKNEDN